ncbi:J domain-containing protein [Ornithobacterium rhinotracheale]|uniref:J domain-containing protein n=1 Tax=Ornithobacterium rhinotracheale TaxID=28251 RepID=UPI00129C21A4|nr:DnaJ domain-containing protein [Ornithobacterium rhinotracheale]MRJ09656.1 J domain-containing protein [Ornithobacterium rhinotracheale]
MFKDYYEILQVPQRASPEEIKNAFKEQARRWHPDRNQGEDTTLKMQEINEAYLVLKDKEARARYDEEYNRFKNFETHKEKTKGNEYAKTENYQESSSSYTVEDEILKKWMKNARRQSVEIVEEALREAKGVTRAAAGGCINGVITIIIWSIVINLLVFLVRMCSSI